MWLFVYDHLNGFYRTAADNIVSTIHDIIIIIIITKVMCLSY